MSYQLSYGEIMPHYITALKGNCLSHQLKWGQTLKDTRFKSLYKCQVQRGFLANYTKFDNLHLGQTFILGTFLNPTWTIGNKIDLVVPIALGLSFSTNPFEPNKNPWNENYSTITNLYGTLGLEIAYRLNDIFSISGFFQIQHISNGRFKAPNGGLNWYTGGIGVYHNLTKRHAPYWLPKDTSRLFKQYVEIATFIAYPSLNYPANQRYLINGIIVQYGKRGLLHGWNAGLEISHDPLYVARGELKKTKVSPFLLSAVCGHEFILGKLLFSQQLGIYLQQTHAIYQVPFYHRWGLTFPFTKHLSFGLNLKAHLQVANFFDARVVYKIK